MIEQGTRGTSLKRDKYRKVRRLKALRHKFESGQRGRREHRRAIRALLHDIGAGEAKSVKHYLKHFKGIESREKAALHASNYGNEAQRHAAARAFFKGRREGGDFSQIEKRLYEQGDRAGGLLPEGLVK